MNLEANTTHVYLADLQLFQFLRQRKNLQLLRHAALRMRFGRGGELWFETQAAGGYFCLHATAYDTGRVYVEGAGVVEAHAETFAEVPNVLQTLATYLRYRRPQQQHTYGRWMAERKQGAPPRTLTPFQIRLIPIREERAKKRREAFEKWLAEHPVQPYVPPPPLPPLTPEQQTIRDSLVETVKADILADVDAKIIRDLGSNR